MRKISVMESPTRAALAAGAEGSDFFQTELEAFVETSKRQRPRAWAQVEQLKRACQSESPASLAVAERSTRLLEERGARGHSSAAPAERSVVKNASKTTRCSGATDRSSVA